jgi:5-methylcytosine-specific restriction endonuclease McrA
MNANWKLPKTQKALHNLLHKPKEGDFWQADHIKAVAEGGGDAGLDNLRTLCTPCHQVETERLRGRLKLMYHGKSKDIKETAGSDIRALFATQQQQSTRKSRKKYSAD